MIAIFVLPHDCRLNKVIFMYTMGSLLWAVPIWRNSLVFHDVDKVGRWVGKGVGHPRLLSSFHPFFLLLCGVTTAFARACLGVLCSFLIGVDSY